MGMINFNMAKPEWEWSNASAKLKKILLNSSYCFFTNFAALREQKDDPFESNGTKKKIQSKTYYSG